jgi:mycothiol maleylpyruvate isomerase-like protein
MAKATGGTGRSSETAVDPDDLLAAEEAGWTELRSLIGSLKPEQAVQPGYYPEGWSAKDVLAHIGAWLAEAGVMLERIAVGTYRPEEIDIEAINKQTLETMRDIPFPIVMAQAAAARTRMRHALLELPEHPPEAAFWIKKAGPEHYEEHLPRLREWVEELRSDQGHPVTP